MEIARGLITQIDPKNAKAKAKLPDMEALETDWLPVLQTFTKGAASYAMPREGQQVYVVFLDEHAAEGLIIGGRYSQKNKPPEALTKDDLYWSLEDGTKIRLTPNEIILETPGNLTAKADGDATITIGGKAEITIGGSATAKIGGDANITVSGSAAVQIGGEATIESGGPAKITAPQITLDAPVVKVTGMMQVTGIVQAQDAISSGKSFLAHTHTPSVPVTTPRINHLDERVTVAVLGQTLTSGQTQGGGGSHALGLVHDGVRYDLLEADARQLSATLTQQLAKPLVDLNLGPRDVYPKIELFVKKPSDLTALADQLTKLVPLGLKIDAKEVRDKWGFSEPEEGAEILTAPQMPSQFGGEFPGMPGMDGHGPDDGEPGMDGHGPDDGEPEPAPASQPEPVESGVESVQDTALNGAQTASLLQILDSVTSGRLPKSAAKEVIKASFPRMPHDRIDGMVDPIEVMPAGGADAPVEGGVESEHSVRKVKPRKLEYAEVVSNQLEIAAADAMDGLLEPVRRLVSSANSYQEILDGVSRLFPEMDDESYTEQVAGALVAANLAGASTVRKRRNG